MEKNYSQLKKLVISPSEIDSKDTFRTLNLDDNLCSCCDCNSNLCYVKTIWGVIDEDFIYRVVGNRTTSTYNLREVGLVLYCAECGSFNEHYSKWVYPEDKIIKMFDEIDSDEKMEIEHCLHQYNQKGTFTPLYKCSAIGDLKQKLDEYEIKHKLKTNKKGKKLSL